MKRPLSPEAKAAMLADYAAGMSSNAVASKYGVAAATAHRHIKAAGISRSLSSAIAAAQKARIDAEFGLDGGHWMPNLRGIQVWQPCFHDSIQTCTINHQENPNAA